MNPEPLEQQLREIAWRRPLTDAEQAQLSTWLAQHPEARAEWAADAALSAALARLRERPAPSNLTARVLAAVDRDDLAHAGARPARGLGWLLSTRWMPRAAVVALILATSGFAFHLHRQAAQARAVRVLAEAAHDLPSPEVLADLDAIIRITPDPAADMDLLALDLK